MQTIHHTWRQTNQNLSIKHQFNEIQARIGVNTLEEETLNRRELYHRDSTTTLQLQKGRMNPTAEEKGVGYWKLMVLSVVWDRQGNASNE